MCEILVLRRKPGEEVHLIKNQEDGSKLIERIKVLGVVFGADSKPIVRLGIDASKDTIILREELIKHGAESGMQAEDTSAK